MRQPVRVVLADDHHAFVEGLGMVLSAEDDLEVVALAGDGASALRAVLTHRPDVLVVDTHMPGPAVTELVRLAGQAEPTTRVLLLAEDARLVLSSGPGPGGHAGMTRAASARELAEAIRAVAAGRWVDLPDSFAVAPTTDAPADQPPDRPERDDHTQLLLRSLSPREREILGLLMVRRFLDEASGASWVAPRGGRGTVMELRMPVRSAGEPDQLDTAVNS